MKKTLIGVVIYLLFSVTSAWSQDALHFYELGLKSTMMNKKIHYFTKALELNPKLSAAYEKRGMLYYFQGKYTETLADFRKVADLHSTEAKAYRMLGLAYMKRGEHDTAIAHFTRAIELDHELASAYSHRAEAYLFKGMAAEAVKDATKAIALRGAEPIIGRAYTIRSKAYRKLGQEGLAEADFNKAYILDPDNYAYRYFTITNHLASIVSDSGYINAGSVRRVGFAAIIALLFVLIFKVVLPAPSKDDIS
jgi:tetratricopeptide (TPR) repeat protein